MVRFAGANSGGNFEESPEETRKWQKLVKHFQQNGGPGTQLDFEAEWVAYKHPYELKRYNPVTKQREVKDPNGCQFTFELRVAPVEGLRFWDDGAYSDHQKAKLPKIVQAAAGRRLRDDEEVEPQDFLKRRLILTIEMGSEITKSERKDERGGFFWNVRGYKPVPRVAAFADDDDEPVAPAPEVAQVTNSAPVEEEEAIAPPF